jgi:hypothetical protein
VLAFRTKTRSIIREWEKPMFDRLAWRSEYDRYLGLGQEEEVGDEEAAAAATANAATANAATANAATASASRPTLPRPAP